VADDHDALDALSTRQELRLGDDRATTPCLAALTTTLLLGLETGGTLDRGDLVTVRARRPDLRRRAAATATATA